MFDSKTQSTSYYFLLTLKVFNANENIVLEQDHNDRLNFDNLIKSIFLSRDSMLSSIVLILSISSIKNVLTTLISYVSSLDVN